LKSIIYIFILMSAMLVGTITAFAGEEKLPLATGEWPPYTSQNLVGYGFITEIVSAVVHEMGMKPEYRFYPWKRAEVLTGSGKFFGAFPYAVTEERQKEFDFSEIILENRSVFFYYKPHMEQPPKWKTLEDLRPYRIGGVYGYSYVPAFTKAGLNVKYVTKDEHNVKKLRSGRLDLFAMDTAVGLTLSKQLYPQELEMFGILDPPLSTGNSHLMISRTYPDSGLLRDRFNQALQRVRDKGAYQSILEKYGIRP
jgi:polar amino acid transport system substrate-binding protein